MAANGTLLCIHRDPAQLGFLQENGYDLVTAATGREGLRLFMSRTVDAIVLEYHLGLLDGAAIADEIKQVRPQMPIVMLADHVEFPNGALKSVGALVARADGPHFLLATVHFVLNIKARTKAQFNPKRSSRARGVSLEDSFSPEVWNSIRNGTVQF